MINLIRKFNGSMVIIGYSGKDIHPHLRRLCDYVEKEDKKDAAIFETVEEAEGKDKKFDLSRIPQTSLPYDTKESSSWEWATEEGKDLVQIACETYIASNMIQQEVADIFEISAAKISQNYRQYEEI